MICDLRVSATCECLRLASVRDLRVSVTCECPRLASVRDLRVSATLESICGGGDLDAVCGHHL